MPIPIDQRRKPASVKIHVSSGAGVDIAWADGHASHFDFAYLRENCPCATCNDERLKKESLGEASAVFASSPALPMFKPKARAQSQRPLDNTLFNFLFPMATRLASIPTSIFALSVPAPSVHCHENSCKQTSA